MHGNENAADDICHKVLVGVLRNHVTFIGKLSISCEICQAKFAEQQSFISHNCGNSSEKLFAYNMAHNCNTADENSLICDLSRTEATVNNSAHAIEKSLSCVNKSSNNCNTVDDKSFDVSQNEIPNAELTVQNYIDHVEKSFTCETCYKEFSDKESFTAHNCVDVSKISFTCPKCQKKFSTIISYGAHNCSQIGEESFACDMCHKDFSNKLFFNDHNCAHRSKNSFAKKIDIKKHSESVESPIQSISQRLQNNSYPCDICHKQFKQRLGLSIHHNTRPDESPFTCDTCKKLFCHKRDFRIHLQVHGITGKCEICKKQFTENIYLNEHLKSRSDGSPFTCVTCEKQFCLKWDFDAHIHTCGCPYKCKVCNKEFNRKHNLKLHLATHPESLFHATGNLIECQVCYKVFAFKKLLKKHLTNTRSKESPFSCPKCEMLFCFKNDFNTHFLVHDSEECKVCHKKFSTKRTYANHYRIHVGEQTLTNDIMNTEFADKKSTFHNSIDDIKKSLSCSICDIYFSDIESFTDHKCNFLGEKRLPIDASNKEITENELCYHDYNFLVEKSLNNCCIL